MDKNNIIEKAAEVAKAIHMLPDKEKKIVLTMSRRVAKLSGKSCRENAPVQVTRSPEPSDVFWAVAEAAGCTRVPGIKGCKGSPQMLCGPGVNGGDR